MQQKADWISEPDVAGLMETFNLRKQGKMDELELYMKIIGEREE